MSATELIAEKSRTLTAPQAEVVLAYIDEITKHPGLSAVELMRLAPEVRDRVLAAQMAAAEAIYRENPDLIWDDAEAPMEYA